MTLTALLHPYTTWKKSRKVEREKFDNFFERHFMHEARADLKGIKMLEDKDPEEVTENQESLREHFKEKYRDGIPFDKYFYERASEDLQRDYDKLQSEITSLLDV